MSPSATHGKICYVEIPSDDPRRSAEFYAAVFGWNQRTRGDGAIAFDDTTGAVSGAFVRGRAPGSPGPLIYVMVVDIGAAVAAVEAHGGVVTQPCGADAPELTARFRDPGGNVLGLYEEPRKTSARS
jgi:predicted enzyme related to lactoylglutathione lyase